MLYRAEDDSGSMVIGMHTSRLGLASSSDGVNFTTEPTPVFILMLIHRRIENGRVAWKILAWSSVKMVRTSYLYPVESPSYRYRSRDVHRPYPLD